MPGESGGVRADAVSEELEELRRKRPSKEVFTTLAFVGELVFGTADEDEGRRYSEFWVGVASADRTIPIESSMDCIIELSGTMDLESVPLRSAVKVSKTSDRRSPRDFRAFLRSRSPRAYESRFAVLLERLDPAVAEDDSDSVVCGSSVNAIGEAVGPLRRDSSIPSLGTKSAGVGGGGSSRVPKVGAMEWRDRITGLSKWAATGSPAPLALVDRFEFGGGPGGGPGNAGLVCRSCPRVGLALKMAEGNFEPPRTHVSADIALLEAGGTAGGAGDGSRLLPRTSEELNELSVCG